MTGLRKRLLLLTRAVIVMLIIAALAGPARVSQTGRKALGIVVDASQSMGEEGAKKAMEQARRLQSEAGGIDSFIVQLGAKPDLLPEKATEAETKAWQTQNGGDSHYAAALEYAEAMFPPGTSRNVLIIGDGHETRGDLLAAAREAAATEQGAPIAKAVIEALKERKLLVPMPELLIRLALAGRAAARRQAYRELIRDLEQPSIEALDQLLAERAGDRSRRLGNRSRHHREAIAGIDVGWHVATVDLIDAPGRAQHQQPR